jgi:hypothetical protein
MGKRMFEDDKGEFKVIIPIKPARRKIRKEKRVFFGCFSERIMKIETKKIR